MEKRLPRKLAAILYADVVEYSRLTGEDEDATHRTLTENLDQIANTVDTYNGRIMHYAGDAVLAMFEAVVDALSCAAQLQLDLKANNEDLSTERRVRFRIGVNMGDVIEDRGDIYGDGVNVAARLESLAEPGGICISESVHTAIGNKLPFDYEFMGERDVKNIAKPVKAYHARLNPGAVLPESSVRLKARRPQHQVITTIAVSLVLIFGVAVVGWWQPWQPKEEPATIGHMASPLRDKPSIAVLPFTNMSDDSKQEYFADGMTEDLITDLTKISDLTVISRTSTSGYKGRKIDIREVGKALNVRYVIEGSVRKAGGWVRINAQLIDATTGGHLWAERYDGNLNDIFGLQDQVLEKIVGSLALKLSAKERGRLATRGTDSVLAHDIYMRGLFQESTFTREGNREAIRFYEQAISIDPNYALPYTRIANILQLNTRNGWSDNVQADLKKAVELAEKAIALDSQDPYLHWSLGRSVARLRTPETLKRGIKALEQAIELDPNFADAYAFLTVLYAADGRAEDGLRSIETAMRLNPRYPFWYLFMRGMARYVVEDYESAIADFEAAAERNSAALFVRWWLAASYAQVGQIEDAEWQVVEMQSMGFDSTITTIIETGYYQDPRYVSLYKEGLRKAGIPE
jgi:adenylate cyclase